MAYLSSDCKGVSVSELWVPGRGHPFPEPSHQDMQPQPQREAELSRAEKPASERKLLHSHLVLPQAEN